MKTIKVSEATGTALDWLVAKAANHKLAGVYGRGTVRFKHGVWLNERSGYDNYVFQSEYMKWFKECDYETPTYRGTGIWRPSVNWSQGGPIMDREGIDPDPMFDSDGKPIFWAANLNGLHHASGPTALIAICRCYVISKLSETAKVPEELL